MKHLPTRKKIRLASSVYNGSAAFSVTIATASREPALTNRDVATICIGALGEAAARHSISVLAHCLMPDHLHLLVGARPGANLIDFMKLFKQLSGYRCKVQFGLKLWQKGYYDHVMRREEDWFLAARYIFENPIRAGLVADWRAFPHSGGTLFEALASG
jgi:REP element-mobilizing transposase RayT